MSKERYNVVAGPLAVWRSDGQWVYKWSVFGENLRRKKAESLCERKRAVGILAIILPVGLCTDENAERIFKQKEEISKNLRSSK